MGTIELTVVLKPSESDRHLGFSAVIRGRNEWRGAFDGDERNRLNALGRCLFRSPASPSHAASWLELPLRVMSPPDLALLLVTPLLHAL
jgi:hypothetical protein